MINLKRILIVFLLILVSCSNNDSDSSISNGFKVNGTFYETGFANAGCCSPYTLVFSSPENHNLGHFSRFDLDTGGGLADNFPLSAGVYSFSNGKLDDQHPIQIVDTNEEESTLAYTVNGSNGIQSGSVTVNSVINDEDGQIIEIDLDYHFVWDGINVIGNYNGSVAPF